MFGQINQMAHDELLLRPASSPSTLPTREATADAGSRGQHGELLRLYNRQRTRLTPRVLSPRIWHLSPGKALATCVTQRLLPLPPHRRPRPPPPPLPRRNRRRGPGASAHEQPGERPGGVRAAADNWSFRKAHRAYAGWGLV